MYIPARAIVVRSIRIGMVVQSLISRATWVCKVCECVRATVTMSCRWLNFNSNSKRRVQWSSISFVSAVFYFSFVLLHSLLNSINCSLCLWFCLSFLRTSNVFHLNSNSLLHPCLSLFSVQSILYFVQINRNALDCYKPKRQSCVWRIV